MINSITIKNVATYEPSTGVHISDLKKVNFFFGFNGSGKSTIVRFLYNLCLESSFRAPEFNNCSQVGYVESDNQILVFDENFTDENFNRNPTLKGVFSLNQANETIDRQITAKEALIKEFDKQIKKKEVLIEKIGNKKRKKQNDLLDLCWKQRNQFTTFTKISLKHSGSKPNNFQEIRNNLNKTALTLQQLTDNYQTLYEKEIKEVTHSVSSTIYKEIRIIEEQLDPLLQEVIVGNEDVDIATLIKQINARNWVETGLYFIDKTNGICPFCQKKTIDERLIEQFNKYFDQTYKDKISALIVLQKSYKEKSDELLANLFEIQNDFNPNNLVTSVYLSVQEQFTVNSVIIANKLKNPNEKKFLVSLNSIRKELSKIQKTINENNKIFSELNINRTTLIANIWNYMASNCKAEIERIDSLDVKYQRIAVLANSLITKYNADIISSKQTIETLRNQTVNTREAVENINIILRNSGFAGFEIAEKETVNNIAQYYLKRQNSTVGNPIFKSLSEGEKNFISFLYFYQLCVGTDNIQNNGSKKKIIVIDDPVSSLDSQALFVVSTLIQNLILRKGETPKTEKKLLRNDNISQVFVFTHNLYFYKEVTFDKRPICTDYWHYMIVKINNITTIKGEYNKTVNDDYSLLWNTIKEIKSNLPTNSHLNIVIANSMRRIIESYVNFIGYGKDSWSALFRDNQEDPTYYIKCAFISTINDESHKITALDSIYYHKITNEQPQILFDVFREIFNCIGKEHYELMMNEQI